jgi:hypothetical protein
LGGGVNFCPECGTPIRRDITEPVRPQYPQSQYPQSQYPQHQYSQPYSQPSWTVQKKKQSPTKIIAAVIVVLLLSVVIIGAAALYDFEEEEETYTQTLPNGDVLILSGAFLPDRNILSLRIDSEEERLAFVLDPDQASAYTYYSWNFFDRDHPAYTETFAKYTGNIVEKSEATLYFLQIKAGVYTITVKCYTGTAGSYHYESTYTGKVAYYTDVNLEQKWKYEGIERELTMTYAYEAYDRYHKTAVNDRWPGPKQYTSFVTYDDPIVIELTEKLKAAFGSDVSPGDSEFANFVLGYVQVCYGYPRNSNYIDADAFLYGQDEYFAYPVETIFQGQGDCEDTAILVAAILHVAGYDTAILILPEHAMAGVALEGYSPPTYNPLLYEVLSKEVDGKMFYGGETTITTYRAFGLSPAKGFGDVAFSYYLNEGNNKGLYKFYVI